jgi:transcriptional regulator with XRE-family HTH domain
MSASEESRALGLMIKEARDKRNLSQRELGEAVGTGQQTVAKIESGQSGDRSPFLSDVLKFLGIDHAAKVAPVEAFKRPQTMERGRRIGHEIPIYRADELSDGEIAIGAEPVEIRALPPWLAQIPGGYAIYMAGMTMFPAIEPGDTLIINPIRPPTLGRKHVFRHVDEASGRAVVGRLSRIDALNWYVQQPDLNEEIVLKRSDWPRAHMITIQSTEPI